MKRVVEGRGGTYRKTEMQSRVVVDRSVWERSERYSAKSERSQGKSGISMRKLIYAEMEAAV